MIVSAPALCRLLKDFGGEDGLSRRIRPARQSKQTDYTGDRVFFGLTDETRQHEFNVIVEKVSNLTGERNKAKCLGPEQSTSQINLFLELQARSCSVSKEGSGDSFGLEFLQLGGFELALWSFSYTTLTRGQRLH